MPRRRRKDHPGAWHHVTTRGIAKRAIFETERDVRYLLACLARQVRAGDIEIHVFTILATHFHLLLRSPRGRLSLAMQRALDAFARWFNRGRRRDGPVFRGRFVNRIIADDRYFAAVVRYIDRNPVKAGMAARPQDYPHGSARYYLEGGGRPWMRKDGVLGGVDSGSPGVEATAADYRAAFGEGADPGRNDWVVERCLRIAPDRRKDPCALGSAGTGRWMRWKAHIADGSGGDTLLFHPEDVREAVERLRTLHAGPGVRSARNPSLGWESLEAAALREFSGLGYREIASRLGWKTTRVRRRLGTHAQALTTEPRYRAAFEAVFRSIPNPTQNRRSRS